jgi:hypothetical protein
MWSIYSNSVILILVLYYLYFFLPRMTGSGHCVRRQSDEDAIDASDLSGRSRKN